MKTHSAGLEIRSADLGQSLAADLEISHAFFETGLADYHS
jgi:hypothetical protein